ncbi:MAG TPA: hypothetical protein PKC40_03960, partial [Saprospiraceae bacterium]|nr:hypothetical protein [Saprospiraceae bacterium]
MGKEKIIKTGTQKKKSSSSRIGEVVISPIRDHAKGNTAPELRIRKTKKDYTHTVLSKAEILASVSQSGNNATLLEELLVLTGLSKNILSEQIFEIPTDLFNQYIDNVKVLPTALKERIVKIIELYKLGIELFESAKEFNSWLSDSSYEFSKTIP